MKKAVILIIEDDVKAQRLMRDVLVHEGHVVFVADTAEAGIELIRSLAPSLVLMDIHLPGISGLEAIRVIRADALIARTRVIAVTATSTARKSDIESSGFDGFQAKPLMLAEFLGTIRSLIHS